MAGPEQVLEVVVRSGFLVAVGDDHGDRGTGGQTVVEPGQDLDPVGFVALGHEPALTGPTAVEVVLDRIDVECEPGRAPVDHDPHCGPVRLAERLEPEQPAEGTGHQEPG